MISFQNNEHAGLLPQFFSPLDPRPAAEQLHENYAHGGGVHPFEGFKLVGSELKPLEFELHYPGDPPFIARDFAYLRDELILLFPYDWVCIVQPDSSFMVTRCD
jgi:hypothetical protein